nr:unnamed protein product [Callosobruchus chinensis]
MKSRSGRGTKISKCYVALFVCFLSKAVHLELVTDLSKDCFILALRRFISRRGKPSRVFSDNGTNFVAANLRSISLNRLDIYQHLQQMKQHIWSRWSKGYVTELQQRCKWKSTQGELKEGDMVIIKEDNLPPFKWKLGRVTSLHSGSDGVNRVATVKTLNGFVKRAFTKLCPLPLN